MKANLFEHHGVISENLKVAVSCGRFLRASGHSFRHALSSTVWISFQFHDNSSASGISQCSEENAMMSIYSPIPHSQTKFVFSFAT